MSTFKISALVIVIVIILVGTDLSLTVIDFRDSVSDIVLQLLISFIAITVLLERALDVFLTTWRAERSESLDLEIDTLSKQFERADKKKQAELLKKLDKISQQKQRYRAQTRTIAMWTSLVIGVLISGFAGIRTLEHMVTDQSMAMLHGFQLSIFKGFDIFLTGGLIAGGSDGIHKVMELLRQFLETNSQRLKKSKI